MTTPAIGFFEASAQLIPLLFLALVVEYRFYQEPVKLPEAWVPMARRQRWIATGRLVTFLTSGLGLGFALAVLATGTPTKAATVFVLGAYIVMGAALIAPLMGPFVMAWYSPAASVPLPLFVLLALLAPLYGLIAVIVDR